MPALSVNRTIQKWRSAFTASALGQFLSWWGRELSGLMPQRVRTWFAESREEIYLQLEADEVVLSRARPRLGEEAKRFSRADGLDALKQTLTQINSSKDEIPLILFVVPEKRIMTRSLNLPLAAQDNLRQVVGFEMDRQTPFRADQVYYDYRIAKRDAASKVLKVEFAATPKAALDQELNWFASAAIGLDGVDGFTAQSQSGLTKRIGFNLLDSSQRASHSSSRVRLNWVLSAIALALLFVVMHQSLSNREQALLDMQAQLDRLDLEARKVKKLRKQLIDAVSGANFLAEKRQTIPRVIMLVKDLTQRLPNDTFIQSITFNQGKVTIAGQAKDANSLIVLLQKSPILSQPTIEGQVSTDPRTNKEIFRIGAQFRSVVAAEEKAKAKEKANEKSKNKSSGGKDADSA